MNIQTKLFKSCNLVPSSTKLSDKIINGFRIITASDLEIAKDCIDFARIRGSVSGEDYYYEVAGPEVMIEGRKIVRWAIVEKI